MYSKFTIALVVALSAFAFAFPMASRAEDQAEWLQRQLQMTDGYAPPPAVSAQEDVDRSGTSPSRGDALGEPHPVMLRARGGHRTSASSVHRDALRASHAVKPAPESPDVYQQPAYSEEAPDCEEAPAEDELSPTHVECADCTVIEPMREARDADMPSEGIGFAAVGALLALAGFKVVKTLSELEQA